MANIRRRKSRRKAKINSTQYAKKQKRKQRKKVHIELDCVREKWDHRKSLKQNLSALGLVYDPNKVIPIKTKEKQEELGDIKEYRKTDAMAEETSPPSGVIKELEELSAQPVHKKTYCMSRSEAKFIAGLIKTHGTDYKKMVRDKRNYNQLTENQLRKRCEVFYRSPHIEETSGT